MTAREFAALAVLALLLGGLRTEAQVVLTEGTNLAVDVSAEGQVVTDLLGGLWVVPLAGGEARALDKGPLPAGRPRWSPDAGRIAYQVRSGDYDQLRIFDLESGRSMTLGDGGFLDQHPSWHPDGTRLVFSSDRRDTGFDLWETDVTTGLAWRLSSLPGDETEPAWSGDGRDLLFVHEEGGTWSIMIRRRGEDAQAVVTSGDRLSAPSWRPDGSLVTYLRETDEGLIVEMAILSDPVLVRTLVSGEDFFDAPLAWHGRQQMVYAANGNIRKRAFNSWTSRTVPFQARVEGRDGDGALVAVQRELPVIDAPQSRLVVRAQRLFGGAGFDYREDLDVVIENGRIAAVEPRRDRSGSGDIVIDMGDLTLLPGFVDTLAALPERVDEALGPVLLSYGITTIVVDHEQAAALNARWSGKEMPGPRVLSAQDIGAEDIGDATPWLVTLQGDLSAGIAQRPAVTAWQGRGVPVLAENWQVGLGSGASMVLSGESMPASPGGVRYQDALLGGSGGEVTLVSGLADAQTPGLDAVIGSRQAELLGPLPPPARRFSTPPQLPSATTRIVIGSKPNGLPPGMAFHAELRALASAGLDAERVLRAASINAAGALSASLEFGRIAANAQADLVFVDGDPLGDIDDTLNVVAVVRNGRFFSVAGLLETSRAAR